MPCASLVTNCHFSMSKILLSQSGYDRPISIHTPWLLSVTSAINRSLDLSWSISLWKISSGVHHTSKIKLSIHTSSQTALIWGKRSNLFCVWLTGQVMYAFMMVYVSFKFYFCSWERRLKRWWSIREDVPSSRIASLRTHSCCIPSFWHNLREGIFVCLTYA